MIFHKRLHRLIRSKTETTVELCGSAVAVFSALPEQAVIVAKERRILHLRLMFENGVTLKSKFFRAHRHSHLDVVDFPFCPSAAIHPNTAILHKVLI